MIEFIVDGKAPESLAGRMLLRRSVYGVLRYHFPVLVTRCSDSRVYYNDSLGALGVWGLTEHYMSMPRDAIVCDKEAEVRVLLELGRRIHEGRVALDWEYVSELERLAAIANV